MPKSTSYEKLEQTAADVWMEEGREEGRKEGRLEGEIRASHRHLVQQGRKLFGVFDRTAESAIKAIQDIDRLDRLVVAVLSAHSWTELLSTP